MDYFTNREYIYFILHPQILSTRRKDPTESLGPKEVDTETVANVEVSGSERT